jgi:Flp pilus assembly protein CpaB
MPMPNLPIKTGHIFIGLAVVMGLATVGIFSSNKEDAPRKVVAEVETQNVVVPLVPINQGSTLSRNDVTVVKWPSAYLPKGKMFNDAFQLVGRVAKQDLFPGEPIFNQKVSGGDTHGGLTAIIPPGMRAITIAVTEVKGVAGFIKPGDRVDILTTFELQKTGGQSARKTRTVLQDVLVLASAQTMVDDNKYSIDTPPGVTKGEATSSGATKTKDDEAKDAQPAVPAASSDQKAIDREKEKTDAEKAARLVSSITLALSPEQTETMALAEESGSIRLSLRSDEDHALAKLDGVNSDQLLGHAPPPPMPKYTPMPRVAPPPMPMPMPMMGTQVEFIQGNDKTLYNFNQ